MLVASSLILSFPGFAEEVCKKNPIGDPQRLHRWKTSLLKILVGKPVVFRIYVNVYLWGIHHQIPYNHVCLYIYICVWVNYNDLTVFPHWNYG